MAAPKLLDVVRDFKAGKLKKADVRPGIRKQVERMANDPTIADHFTVAPKSPVEKFGVRERFRGARTV